MVRAFVRHRGKVVALPRRDVDTDQIIPKQFLKAVDRTGFASGLFFDWRADPNFELNRPAAQGATILVTGPNFGCGSSREHAVWALAEYGFRAIIAPSFADIFTANCYRNGVLPVQLTATDVEILTRRAEAPLAGSTYEVVVDLEKLVVRMTTVSPPLFAPIRTDASCCSPASTRSDARCSRSRASRPTKGRTHEDVLHRGAAW